MATVTPMMQQYLEIKQRHQDSILFFRLGDFYEMFFEDAQLASRELEIALTGKDCGLQERAPMCGVPYHAVDAYVAKLIDKGYKVAICEQLSDPKDSPDIVKRDVVRIVTPGTVIESSMLEERRNNYLIALYLESKRAGAAFTDVSTGEFSVYEIDLATDTLEDELSRLQPREMLINDDANMRPRALAVSVPLSALPAEEFELSPARQVLTERFGQKALDALELSKRPLAMRAAGALLRFLARTQLNALCHISQIGLYARERYMALDELARRNLELTETMRDRKKRGSLLWLLDRTKTAMGGRQLRMWIEHPLQSAADIEARLDAVELLKADAMLAQALREELAGVCDMERMLARIAYGTVNARDCLALAASLRALTLVRDELRDVDSALIAGCREMIDPMDALCAHLTDSINPDAPVSLREGGLFLPGFHAELDALRNAATDGREWLATLEAQERESTGIRNLKIGFNKVFGYYIEVTKSYYDLVPYRYTRKQTLANCERFITQELKVIQDKVLGADERAVALEYQLFQELRQRLEAAVPALKRTALGVKTVDALLSLACVAQEHGYVRPTLNESGVLDIADGRHPVVERALGEANFVPNDTHIDGEQRVMIITGPNMAGKSTYMRQVALIVLMAHMGSFVPAARADICLTDRIFTRIGASDDLFSGQSTFMVEMGETAGILRHATSRSLLILDEIGRGTSTFDGLSIAWAVVEHIADIKRCGAKALFATHYHELSELEGKLSSVVNYCITAREHGDEVIFLRKIARGGADRSFGVAVASLAGLPGPVLMRAREIMARLEAADINQTSIGSNILSDGPKRRNKQVGLFEFGAVELTQALLELDVMSMSPLDALNELFRLKEKARLIK